MRVRSAFGHVFAPAIASTITFCPLAFCKPSAKPRAKISDGPPAGKLFTMRTGLLGQAMLCALAGKLLSRASALSAAQRRKVVRASMMFSPFMLMC